jgi:hypothetical protein
MDGSRLALGWFWVHRELRPQIGCRRGFHHRHTFKNNAVNDGIAVLAVPPSCLDQNALLQEVDDRALHGTLAELCMALDRAFGAPDARAAVARLVGQNNMIICLRAALPKQRSAHSFAIRQLMIAPPIKLRSDRNSHGNEGCYWVEIQ